LNPIALLRAMRPSQWAKNLFVLAPVVFARGDVEPSPADWHDVWQSLYAFLAFCASSSAIYLINDVLDVESDRAHPTKCRRPIASGALAVGAALLGSSVLVAAALVAAWRAGGGGFSVVQVVGVYVLLNFAYSVKLKQLVLVDVFCIAAGFLFRVRAGGLAAETNVSHWLMLCTLFLALFLALNKRRSEIDLLGERRADTRSNLGEYTVGFLDQMVTMLAATTILCYAMYTVAGSTSARHPGNHLLYSVPFVVFGMSRYMFLVHTQQGGENPTRVLLGGDWMFAVNAIAWGVVVAASIF
jgi:4-hydroxybenzoate polyprenyltransferase